MRTAVVASMLLLSAACGSEGPQGSVVTLAGGTVPGFADGVGDAARFRAATGIAIDEAATIYVADAAAHAIRRVTRDGSVVTLVGGNGGGFVDGPASAARLFYPIAIAIDRGGDLVVGDGGNQALRRVDPDDGSVSTIAGGETGYEDGPLASARFGEIAGVAIDPATGAIYVCDFGNHAVRMIDEARGEVVTIAGGAASGFADGTGTAARFDGPAGIALDSGGRLWIADERNHAIRRIDRDGVVTTIAGRGGVQGYAEGPGTRARFARPWGMALDGDTLYVADSWNHVLRAVTADGYTRRVAGIPTPPSSLPSGNDGDVNHATFRLPKAHAHVVVANDVLDDGTKRLGADALAASGGKRDAAPFSKVLGGEAPSALAGRPLREQARVTLDRVVVELRKLPEASALRAWADRIATAAQGAIDVLDARSTAQGRRASKRNEVDEWKEGINRLRQATYGELVKIASTNGLSKSWANQFFVSDSAAAEPATDPAEDPGSGGDPQPA